MAASWGVRESHSSGTGVGGDTARVRRLAMDCGAVLYVASSNATPRPSLPPFSLSLQPPINLVEISNSPPNVLLPTDPSSRRYTPVPTRFCLSLHLYQLTKQKFFSTFSATSTGSPSSPPRTSVANYTIFRSLTPCTSRFSGIMGMIILSSPTSLFGTRISVRGY